MLSGYSTSGGFTPLFLLISTLTDTERYPLFPYAYLYVIKHLKRKDMRKINLLVLHCSATRENQVYTPEQLERDHKARGFVCAGYNFYVRRTGEVISMRPIEQIPAHTRGYNRNSIGICYEGGLDSEGKPEDTRTTEQKKSLRILLLMLLGHYPGSRICGHRDLGAPKACPCFNAEEEYADL